MYHAFQNDYNSRFSQCEILEGVLSSQKMGLSLKPRIHRANINEYRLWQLEQNQGEGTESPGKACLVCKGSLELSEEAAQ